MTQKVFVTHYEAQIPLVVYRRGCNVINPSKSEHQEFLVRKGLLIGQIGFFSFPTNTGVTWRVVRVPPPPSPAGNAEHQAEVGDCQDRVSPKAS